MARGVFRPALGDAVPRYVWARLCRARPCAPPPGLCCLDANLRQDSVALEGTTIRRSLDSADGTGPIRVVKAWASANALGLARFKVDSETNESTALPELLRMLNLAGAVVPIDAMGWQGEIARQIQEQGADYVLSVKETQPSLSHDWADLCVWLQGSPLLDPPVAFGYAEPGDGGHGRIETRRGWSTAVLAGLEACARWPGLSSLVMVEAIRQLGAEESMERRDSIRAC